MRRIVLVFVLVLLACVFAQTPLVKAFTWNIQTVDSEDHFDGMYSSIALDSNDRPYISYQADVGYFGPIKHLKVANLTGSAWLTDFYDSSSDDTGYYTSIAIDSYDNWHVSYRDDSNDRLIFDKLYLVENYAGWSSSMALDSHGNPHLSYVDKDGYLKYAYWTGSSWSVETLMSDCIKDEGGTSIALSSDDRPYISFYSEAWYGYGALKYAEWIPDYGWYFEALDEDGWGAGLYSSIALDSYNNPHISYYWGALKYVYWSAGSWHKSYVDYSDVDVGEYTSIAIDSLGNPHIAYYDSTHGDLKYAYWAGSSWIIETVDSVGDVGTFASMKLDSHDIPHISYYDATNGDLKYARLDPPSAPQNLVAVGGNARVDLYWQAPSYEGSSQITNYKIYKLVRLGMFWIWSCIATVGNVLTYTDTDVVNDQTYHYKVRAVNFVGEGPLSDEAVATPVVPEFPQSLVLPLLMTLTLLVAVAARRKRPPKPKAIS